jgi:hypothetical protein
MIGNSRKDVAILVISGARKKWGTFTNPNEWTRGLLFSRILRAAWTTWPSGLIKSDRGVKSSCAEVTGGRGMRARELEERGNTAWTVTI